MANQAMLEALNLEMGPVVPRTEYSAHFHWNLIEKVTGIHADENSPEEVRQNASREFVKAWDYCTMWKTSLHREQFRGKCTDMGHAAYVQGGGDFSASTHSLFEDPEDVYDFDLFESIGTPDKAAIIARCDADYERQNRLFPTCENMTGIYITCISGLIELLGWDTLLMAAGIDREAFGAFTDRYCEWIYPYFEALSQVKSPLIMVHDDMVWGNGAFLPPEFYRQHVFKNYKRLFRPIIDSSKKLLFTCDGNFSEFIDDVADCGVHGFVMEPATDMKHIAEKYGKTHVFIGNADTNALLSGTRDDIEREVKRCMDIGKNCPGFIMAVGNHIPPNTPVENALIYDEIYRRLGRR